MGTLVHYKCVSDSYDWGKKGATNRIFFKDDYSEEIAKSYAPSNWVIDYTEEIDALPDVTKEEEE